ncbi:MAG: ABC-F family ATP-binding cassette domain-containing protein [Bdellovibrionia bacterium]
MIHIHGISKQYGSKVLFENAEAHLGQRSKTALIGPNGAGKSTLIRVLLGTETADGGSVSRARHLAIGYLAQEVPKFSGRSVLTEVMRMDGRREELIEAKNELEELFSKAPSNDGIGQSASSKASSGSPANDDHFSEGLERYGRILEELDGLDEYRLEARAKEILTGMGFKLSDLDRSLTEFSGGWLMRVALSRILLMDPDLLILDEPTNHLDLESLLWLEEFLRAFRGAMLLVSHDQAFLNRIVNEVLEIDQKRLWVYRGNLDSYAEQKSERLEVLKAQYAGQQSKIAEVEKFVSRFGAKATKARQAQSKLKQLEKMERIELPEHRDSVRFRFPPAPHSGKEVVTVRRGAVRYGTKTVFRDLDWVVSRGARVAIVGVNGAGKTTLLKLLSGQLAASEGEAKLGHQVKVGYYAQLQAESLDLNKTILEELESVAPHLPMSQVRGVAGAFLFSGELVEKKCGILSGGEKARVALAKLLLSPSNFLILDEPTNHLDVESREILLEALQDYEGTLCLVSHDRSFVSPLVNSVLEIEPQESAGSGSRVVQLLGSYDEYLEKKIKEASAAGQKALSKASGNGAPNPERAERVAETSAKSQSEVSTPKPGVSNNQRKAWEKERDQLEALISKLEKRQEELHIILADTSLYEDKEKSNKMVGEQRTLEKNLGESLARWEELCNLL